MQEPAEQPTIFCVLEKIHLLTGIRAASASPQVSGEALKRFLSIFSDRIFDSSVDRGMPSLSAAPSGPNTRPRVSECHLEPELNLPRRCHGLEDASRVLRWNGIPARVTAEENLITISTTGPTGSGVYRHVEIGVIEEVEEVSAKLQADALLETHLF